MVCIFLDDGGDDADPNSAEKTPTNEVRLPGISFESISVEADAAGGFDTDRVGDDDVDDGDVDDDTFSDAIGLSRGVIIGGSVDCDLIVELFNVDVRGGGIGLEEVTDLDGDIDVDTAGGGVC